jgi:class 3 adenylate cyclase
MAEPVEPKRNPLGDHRLAAILFTDVANFSGLVETDEKRTLTLVQRDLKLISEMCHRMGGDVLKNTGDGCLVAFSSVEAAVGCAIKIQRLVAHERNRMPPEEILHHRIGIHLGDVYFGRGDVLGNGVNIAARLLAEAEPDGICISQTVYDLVKHRRDVKAINIGPRELKHIREAVQVYRVIVRAFEQEEGEAAKEEPAPDVAATVKSKPVSRVGLIVAVASLFVVAIVGITAWMMARSGKTSAGVAVAPPSPATLPASPATEPVSRYPLILQTVQGKPDIAINSGDGWRRFRIFSNEFLATAVQGDAYVMTIQSSVVRPHVSAAPFGNFGDVTIRAAGLVHGADASSWGLQLLSAQGSRRMVRVTISIRGLVKVDLTRLKGLDQNNNPLSPGDFYLFHNPSIRHGDEANTLVADVHEHKLSVMVNGQRAGGTWDITALGPASIVLLVEGEKGAVAEFRRLEVWRASAAQ